MKAFYEYNYYILIRYIKLNNGKNLYKYKNYKSKIKTTYYDYKVILLYKVIFTIQCTSLAGIGNKRSGVQIRKWITKNILLCFFSSIICLF